MCITQKMTWDEIAKENSKLKAALTCTYAALEWYDSKADNPLKWDKKFVESVLPRLAS